MVGSPPFEGREPQGRSSRSEREKRSEGAWCEPGPFAGTGAPRKRRCSSLSARFRTVTARSPVDPVGSLGESHADLPH
jgi:hypothetical protein